jgi:hypothetical protein
MKLAQERRGREFMLGFYTPTVIRCGLCGCTGPSLPPFLPSYSPNGRLLALVTENKLHIRVIGNKRHVRAVCELPPHIQGKVTHVYWSSNGREVVLLSPYAEEQTKASQSDTSSANFFAVVGDIPAVLNDSASLRINRVDEVTFDGHLTSASLCPQGLLLGLVREMHSEIRIMTWNRSLSPQTILHSSPFSNITSTDAKTNVTASKAAPPSTSANHDPLLPHVNRGARDAASSSNVSNKLSFQAFFPQLELGLRSSLQVWLLNDFADYQLPLLG